jgi:hypothetical protein
LADSISNALLPARISSESYRGGIVLLDRLIGERDTSATLAFDPDFLRRLRAAAQYLEDDLAILGVASVILPAGLWGLWQGFHAPDLDISFLGIQNHRYFLFHSAIGLAALRYFYRAWLNRALAAGPVQRSTQKVAGAILGGVALGVAVHLAVDVFQPKSVVFPFFGTLVEGTLIDDDLWLLGNSLWAFKIAHDVFALAFADELATAKAYVGREFAPLVGVVWSK